MSRISITNDDGIASEGLLRLVHAAQQFGEVWVVAPESQRSAMSHCITFRTPVDVWKMDLHIDGALSCQRAAKRRYFLSCRIGPQLECRRRHRPESNY